ncbi:MAG: Nramp family divalent metal transporter [Reichenbachiella sp.]
MSKIKTFIASILPGIFLIGYNIGTGSITSMSKAGANFGLELLWAILISCIITYYLINQFSRYTMVTGETIIQGIKKHIHSTFALSLIMALSIIIVTALIGILGIIADVLHVWSNAAFDVNLSQGIWAAVVGFGIYYLIWIGNYSFFEKILAILVAIMGLAFVATMLIDFPSFGELGKGLIPSIPKAAEGSDNSSFVIVSGMVGTTVSVFVFIIRSQIVKETKWTLADDKVQKRDALISASMMFIISAAVMITAYTTLHVRDIKLNNVVEMIALMEPIAGKAALSFFVIGILAAGLSSQLPNTLVIPWLIIDYKNESRNIQSKRNRLILFALTLSSVLGVAIGLKPILIMMLSQACISIVMPMALGSLIYLFNTKAKGYQGGPLGNVLMIAILCFSLYMGILGIQGLIADLM